ncbi:serine hydrolase domain-containing protein [Kitasatospora sp. NPDC006697]|uniref:serine hydrolase domain-containing protein n=1 Tax=Kitasatospora sp. NPDC006697 TaxID=3364020 RepID=UPI003688B9C5
MKIGGTARRHLRRLAVGLLAGSVLLALAPAAGAAGVGAAPVDGAALQQDLDAITGQAGATSAIGEVLEHGRVVWRGGSGVRELGTRAPAAVNGEFRAGSVTKMFVATVALQLSAEGRIGLDDPIERYLPGVVPNGGAITVREVMNHTAGLHDFLDDPQYSYDTEAEQQRFIDGERWNSYPPEQLIAEATGHAPYFAPGTGWHYSNTDYLLLGELIDRVTGHSWRTEVRRRILGPLGLHHTSLPGEDVSVPGVHNHGYLPLSSGPADVTEFNPSVAGAAGELISTTDDLARFDAALLGGRLLAPAQLAEMTATVPADSYPPSRYGLGLMRLALPCGEVWGHPGGIFGYTTYVFGDRAGTRQIAVSVTPYDPVKSAALLPDVLGLLGHAFCG